MKYLKEEIQGKEKIRPYLQEPSVHREKGNVSAQHRKISQASHLICSSQNPRVVTGESVFQIRKLRVRSPRAGLYLPSSSLQRHLGATRQTPGAETDGTRRGRERQRLDSSPGRPDHILWKGPEQSNHGLGAGGVGTGPP